MKLRGHKINLKSSSALLAFAGCTVAFMFIITCISFFLFRQRMAYADVLLKEARYSQYDAYVAMICSDDNSDFWKNVYQSAREAGKEYGIYVDLLSDNVDVNYTKAQLLEMAIDSDCDGILLEGDDSPEIQSLLKEASVKRIPVITLQNDVAAEDRVSFVGVNNYTTAKLYADSLVDNLVKQKHVLVLGDSTVEESTAGIFVNNIQEDLAEEKLPNGPLDFDVEIIKEDDAFAAEEYIQNLFKKSKLAPVVICLDSTTTECFYQAMIDYNKVGQIHLYGNYKTPTILTGIQHGVIKSTVSIDAESMGSAATKAFIEYRDTGYVSDYINVDTQIIDLSNVDEYLEEGSDE